MCYICLCSNSFCEGEGSPFQSTGTMYIHQYTNKTFPWQVLHMKYIMSTQ